MKSNFDKFAGLLRKEAVTDSELCPSSVIDKFLLNMRLSSSALDRLRNEMKGCSVGDSINFIQFTTSLGSALDGAAYTVCFDTQQLE